MRATIVALSLLAPVVAVADRHSAVMSLEGCASIGHGPAVLDSEYGTTDDVSNQTWEVVLLCDADLPSDSIGFDYAVMEMEPGLYTLPPWMEVYVTAEALGPGGARFNWVQAIGLCSVPLAYTGPEEFFWENIPLTLCQTTGGLDWSGIQAQAQLEAVSVFFLVFLPLGPQFYQPPGNPYPSNDSYGKVFRIVEVYEE